MFRFEKNMFFLAKHGPSVPRGRRPLRVPLLLPLSMRPVPWFFYFCNTHTFSFLVPVSVFFAQEGPRSSSFALFSEVFLDALVQEKICKIAEERLFVATSNKCVQKVL